MLGWRAHIFQWCNSDLFFLRADVYKCCIRFVMKVEPHSNGPLFTEMHCLLRIGLQRHRDGFEVS